MYNISPSRMNHVIYTFEQRNMKVPGKILQQLAAAATASGWCVRHNTPLAHKHLRRLRNKRPNKRLRWAKYSFFSHPCRPRSVSLGCFPRKTQQQEGKKTEIRKIYEQINVLYCVRIAFFSDVMPPPVFNIICETVYRILHNDFCCLRHAVTA